MYGFAIVSGLCCFESYFMGLSDADIGEKLALMREWEMLCGLLIF
jgi:hypothetical protein